MRTNRASVSVIFIAHHLLVVGRIARPHKIQG